MPNTIYSFTQAQCKLPGAQQRLYMYKRIGTCVASEIQKIHKIQTTIILFSTVQIYELSYIRFYSLPSMGISQTHKVASSQLAW